MTAIIAVPFVLALGALGWTFAEYSIHRFLMHEMKGRGLPSREHLTHHARKDWLFQEWKPQVTSAAVVTVALFFGSRMLLGTLLATALTVGFTGTWFIYEVQHWRAHKRAPRNRYDAWLRKHHFHHHFGHPMRNHGVLVPLWDVVFGTYDPTTVVKVPRRFAMDWLVDEAGNVKPEYAKDYAVVGRIPATAAAEAAQAEQDEAIAFANLAPVL